MSQHCFSYVVGDNDAILVGEKSTSLHSCSSYRNHRWRGKRDTWMRGKSATTHFSVDISLYFFPLFRRHLI